MILTLIAMISVFFTIFKVSTDGFLIHKGKKILLLLLSISFEKEFPIDYIYLHQNQVIKELLEKLIKRNDFFVRQQLKLPLPTCNISGSFQPPGPTYFVVFVIYLQLISILVEYLVIFQLLQNTSNYFFNVKTK